MNPNSFDSQDILPDICHCLLDFVFRGDICSTQFRPLVQDAGVPGFLLNRRLLVIGAQDTDALVNAFDRAMFGEGNDAIISPALH